MPNTSLAFTWRWALVVDWLAVYNCQLVDEANRLIRHHALPTCNSNDSHQRLARKHLCPGRHFAFAEILGMVALLVVGFDVVMAEG